jgi:hypothetical protein
MPIGQANGNSPSSFIGMWDGLKHRSANMHTLVPIGIGGADRLDEVESVDPRRIVDDVSRSIGQIDMGDGHAGQLSQGLFDVARAVRAIHAADAQQYAGHLRASVG